MRAKWIVLALPGGAFLLYLLALVIHLPAFYAANVTWNSDSITYPLIAQTLATQGLHGRVYLSNAAWYSTILINVLTFHLPDYTLLWQLWPIATFLAAIGLFCWQISHLFGRKAALMAAFLCVAVSPPELFPLMAQAFHGLTTANAIVLAVFLVELVRRKAQPELSTMGVAFLLAIITGINAASDSLLLVLGIVPLVLVSLLLLVRWRDREMLYAAGIGLYVAALSLIVMKWTSAIAERLGFIYRPITVDITKPQQIMQQLATLGEVIHVEGFGTWRYLLYGGHGTLEMALAVATLALLLAGLVQVGRLLARGKERTVVAYTAIWVAIGGACIVALVGTTVGNGTGAFRYVTLLPVAAMALLVQYLAPHARVLAAVATGIILVHAALWFAAPPPTHMANDLRAVSIYLESQHIAYGYADYWEASSITWATGGKVTIREAASCRGASGPPCAMELGIAAQWYTPPSGEFAVLVDPGLTLGHAPVGFGVPIAVHRIHSITIYIYRPTHDPLTIRQW